MAGGQNEASRHLWNRIHLLGPVAAWSERVEAPQTSHGRPPPLAAAFVFLAAVLRL